VEQQGRCHLSIQHFTQKHQGTCPTNGKEIQARGLQDAPNEQSDLVHFVLHLLLQQLIVLYFDIQEHAKHSLDTIISLEDFYLSELNLPLSAIQQLISLRKEESENFLPVMKTPCPANSLLALMGMQIISKPSLGSYVPKLI
jgi:hypothetical protein